MRRTALSAGAIVAALLLQLTLVDRLPLPGGGAPDLVLLVVVALGLTGGPMAGLLTGFWAGLALDVAPPASYLLGEHALVFCLVGYGCGQLSGMTERSAASSLGIAAMAAAGGEVLQVVIGLMFGDPGVSWPAIRTVLPSAVLQDILISPFVVYLMMRATSWAAGHQLGSVAAGGAMTGPLAGSPGAGRGGLADGAVPGLLGGTGWLAGSLGAGRGRKAAALSSVRFGRNAARQGDGWVGSGPRSWRVVRSQLGRGRQPRLRAGAGQAGSATAGQVHRQRPASPVSIRMGSGRRGDGSVGTAFLSGLPGQRGVGGAGGWPGRRPRFRPGGGSPGGLGSTGLGSAGLRGAGRGGAGRGGAGLGSAGLGSTGMGSTGLRGARLRGARPRGTWLRGTGLGGALAGTQVRRGAAARPLSLRVRGDRVVNGKFRSRLRGHGFGHGGLGRSGLGRSGLGRGGLGRSGLGRSGVGRSGLGRSGLGRISLRRRGSGSGLAGGGLAGRSAARPAFRPASQRSAPRFRNLAAAGASRASRQPRLRIGRRSFLARMTTRRATGRSAWWRFGRNRTGGLS